MGTTMAVQQSHRAAFEVPSLAQTRVLKRAGQQGLLGGAAQGSSARGWGKGGEKEREGDKRCETVRTTEERRRLLG